MSLTSVSQHDYLVKSVLRVVCTSSKMLILFISLKLTVNLISHFCYMRLNVVMFIWIILLLSINKTLYAVIGG